MKMIVALLMILGICSGLPDFGSFGTADPLRSEAPNPVHDETHKVGKWEEVEHFHATNEDEPAQVTFRSPVLSLSPGHVINSEASKTPIRMPPGKIAITEFYAEVVDAYNRSVPLHEVYLHHWIIMNGKGNYGPCDTLPFVMGVGAESRGTPTTFGKGYALYCDESDIWTGNIHVINTNNNNSSQLAVENIRACIECDCPFNGGGGVDCCPDRGVCPGISAAARNEPQPPQDFYLQYRVTYYNRNLSLSNVAVAPVSVAVLDVTNCNVEYNLPSMCPWWTLHTNMPDGPRSPVSPLNKPKLGLYYPWELEGEDCPHTLSSKFVMPPGHSTQITHAVGHMHIGGIQITLYVSDVTFPEGKRPICTSTAQYGAALGNNASDAGNELGYLVGLSACDLSDAPVAIKAGDTLTLESVYTGAVPRNGLMGYFLLALTNPTGSAASFSMRKGGANHSLVASLS